MGKFLEVVFGIILVVGLIATGVFPWWGDVLFIIALLALIVGLLRR